MRYRVTVGYVGEPCHVDVIVDGSARLGRLSYLTDPELGVQPGDAVAVPFGVAIRHGIVIGPSLRPEKASRSVIARLGSRSDPKDLVVAGELAQQNAVSIESLIPRLAPSQHKGSRPLDVGPVKLGTLGASWRAPAPPRNWLNRLYLRDPLVDPCQLAAWEADRLARRYQGQVLVLAPTSAFVSAILEKFSSGAVRLDSHAGPGHWAAFREGMAGVGVGTRSAAMYSAESLAGIVVVEEDHVGHLESSTPYTHARSVAARRAAAHGCALTLISACPTPVGMGSRVKVIPVTSRGMWPAVTVVDQMQVAPSERSMPQSVRALASKAHKQGMPVLAVAASRSARLVCAGCGDPVGSPAPAPGEFTCVSCASRRLRRAGLDSDAIRALLPSAEVATWGSLAASPVPRLVVVASVAGFAQSRSLTPEREVFAALVRAAEAAGPGGRVVVLSRTPSDPLLQALLSRDSASAARLVWAAAQDRGVPPFGVRVSARVGTEACPRLSNWPGQIFGPRKVDKEWVFEVLAGVQERDQLVECVRKLRRRGKARVLIEG